MTLPTGRTRCWRCWRTSAGSSRRRRAERDAPGPPTGARRSSAYRAAGGLCWTTRQSGPPGRGKVGDEPGDPVRLELPGAGWCRTSG
jgi:hypothetical protein